MNAASAGLLRTPTVPPSSTNESDPKLPTRSEIEGWTQAISGLASAAESFGRAANQLEESVDAHVRQLANPGGSDWQGKAAESAESRAYSDRGVVYEAADLMRKMQHISNTAFGDLRQARDSVLDAIVDAENNDFQVADDLTVKDTRVFTAAQVGELEARIAAAQSHHSYICMRALQLVAEDERVGAQLSTGAAALDARVPASWMADSDRARDTSHGAGDDIQAYDNETGTDTAEEDGALSGQEIADRLRELQRGQNRGVREVGTEDEIFDLYEELTKGGEPLPTPDNYYDRRVLPDGTIIGVRESGNHGPTLDVKYPPGVTGPDKVHLPPPPPVPPPMPPTPGEAPVIASPPQLPVVDHPPVPGLLPPWAQAPAGIPQGPLPYGGLPPGVSIAAPDTPPLAPTIGSGPDWLPTPSLPATPTPDEQVGIGVLFGGLLAFLGWLGTPKVSY